MARAYHDPKSLERLPEVISAAAESEYYANLLNQMDRDINIKNGVLQP